MRAGAAPGKLIRDPSALPSSGISFASGVPKTVLSGQGDGALSVAEAQGLMRAELPGILDRSI